MPTLKRKRPANRTAARGLIRTRRSAVVDTGPRSLDREARTVRATITSDTPVRIYDWQSDEEIDEVLIPSGMVEPKRMRLRVDHSAWRSLDVIGKVYDFAVGKRTIDATLRFSRASDVEPIFTRVVEGDLDAVSIAASYRLRDTTRLEPGDSTEIDGITYTAKKVAMRLVRTWTPHETSVVDEGADSRALIRSKKAVGPKRQRSSSRLSPLASRLSKNGTRKKSSINSRSSIDVLSEESTTMPKTLKRKSTTQRSRGAGSAQSGSVDATKPIRTRRSARPVENDDVDDADDVDAVDDTDTEQTPKRRARGTTTKRKQVQRTIPISDREGEAPAEPASRNTARSEAEIRTAERKRINAIRELAGDDIPASLVQRAIDEGWSSAVAGKRFLQHMQRTGGTPVGQSGDGIQRGPAIHTPRSATNEGLQAALLLRAGFSLQNPIYAGERASMFLERNGMGWLARMNRDIEDRGNSDVEQIAEVGRRHMSDSALRTCERMLDINDRRRSSDSADEIVERAFSSPYMPRVWGSIVSVGLILGFETYQDSTRGWTSEADWPDFRTNQPIGIDATQGLTKHTRGTEAKDVDFADFGEAYAVARYSGKFKLDDMDIIDDIVGANQMMPVQMGEMAARLRPDLAYGLIQRNPTLSDNVALFHSSRGNALTSNPLSIDNLGVAEAAMATRSVSSKSGKTTPLNLMAGHLVVPRALRAKGKQVISSALVVSGSTTQQGNINPHDGEYKLHSDARLDLGLTDPATGQTTSGSGTTWYITERSGQQTLQFGYRRGTGRVPMQRVRPLTAPGQWGLGWDIAFDIGAGILTARGFVRNIA